MNIVVLNTGSSSLKLSLFQKAELSLPYDALWQTDESIDWGCDSDEQIEQDILCALSPLWQDKYLNCADDVALVGHRVVHGGSRFSQPVIIDDSVERNIHELEEFAPLHNPINLRAIQSARRIFPKATHVAVFDTAFHKTLSAAAYLYPLPYSWFEKFQIRKYGFHGISHQYCSHRAQQMLGASCRRIVTCHLGGGCSLAAVLDGVSVETTMGFTPLSGLMMRTRSGSVDPGILFYMLAQQNMSAAQLDEILNKESGLKGVYQKSGDMKLIVEAMHAGDSQAQLSFDMFIHSASAGVAAMTASLGGLDALVFTGGIGEHAAAVRSAICEKLHYLGVKLNLFLNETNPIDVPISVDDSPVTTLVLRAREDWQIAKESIQLIKTDALSA